jgi:hypothetical protein
LRPQELLYQSSNRRWIARNKGTKRVKGIHPKVNRAATCAFVAALVAGGCRSTSSGIGNPFLAPDRVAPPSTRAIAPGQAQPYYQGDPLPIMQSATAPPASNLTANDSAAARSATGKTLAWNAPAGGAPSSSNAAPTAPTAAPWGANPQPTTPIAYANEPAVSVPVDADSLRFALPAPSQPQPIVPIAAATPTNPQPIQPATAAPNQGVMLATYNAPIATGLSPVVTAPAPGPAPQVASPWRTPQVSPTSPPSGYATQPSVIAPTNSQPFMVPAPPAYSIAQTPMTMPTNVMAVQLRAVPPPPQPGDPLPRVRIPGYEVPQTATADGFRPRSSMR